MNEDRPSIDPLREPNPDLSKLSPEGINRLKDALIERARRRVDPNDKGFDAGMSDETFWSTDAAAFENWWDWGELVVRVISDGFTRLALGMIAAGGTIGAAQMYGSEAGARYATITLAISGVFATWFAVSAVLAAIRRR